MASSPKAFFCWFLPVFEPPVTYGRFTNPGTSGIGMNDRKPASFRHCLNLNSSCFPGEPANLWIQRGSSRVF